MQTLINMVATRSKDGDHAALARWYNDHVGILMASPTLLRAALYRCVADIDTQAPEYLCLYEFSSHADFLAFETGDAREQAYRITQSGWGRDGIEITQRTQYLRLGLRTENDMAGPAPGELHHVQCMRLGAGPAPEVARWLADRVYGLKMAAAPRSVAWHRSVDADGAGAEALVLMKTRDTATAAQALPPASWWQPGTQNSVMGQAPDSVAIRWHGVYRELCKWGH